MRLGFSVLLLISLVGCREERPSSVTDAGVAGDGSAQCLAAPVCAEGETEVPSEADCPADTSCHPVSICGATIWCWSHLVQCAAVPVCAAGETEVAREADCPADTSCRSVSLCGATIWCWSGIDACPGENPQGCAGDENCSEGFRCDKSGGGRPSGCACDPESGSWQCTADVSGGTCVPASS
jgi:hypothetical protein